MYNQVNQSTGSCMPLMMGYTQPEKIREAESDEPIVYDHKKQTTVVLILRLVGTKSLKQFNTKNTRGANSTDKKNEIDDQKNV